jgi:hypothetical protein
MAVIKRDRHKKKGLEWFFNELRKAAKDVNYNAYNPATDPFIGGMFAYLYDPKWKDKLPYWDRLPLVVPFNIYGDGFIGINLHYASGDDRARLLQYLLRLRSKKSTRDYVRVSYQSLQVATKSDVLQPCIHRYLTTHIRTRLVKISMDEWENVASLPLAQWKKGTKS